MDKIKSMVDDGELEFDDVMPKGVKASSLKQKEELKAKRLL